MKNTRGDLIVKMLFVTFGVVFVGIVGFHAIKDTKNEKKYGKPIYEFVITDKYDNLGSNWHLIGGRATESEYHIAYKYRLTNRPDRKDNMVWYSNETTVTSGRYRKLYVGQTLYNEDGFLPY